MSYDPPIKLYYVPDNDSISEQYRIVPAPQININPETYYANDIVIGYTYAVTFDGYATALDLRDPSSEESSINQTLEAIKHIKTLFSINNGTLIVVYYNQEVLRATGGLVRNLSFSNSENNWVNYAPYSITVEFNELSVGSCGGGQPIINCDNIPLGIIPTPNLIEMQKYRVQSFEDSWSISLDENIFNDTNEYFNIEYTVSATGKHYFDNGQLLPAWEQAKNFCQDRLYKEISKLTSTVLDSTYTSCLTNGQTLLSLFNEGVDGILKDIDIETEYGIFNENISTAASEANGSFTLTYKAIVKIVNVGEQPPQNSIHTYTVTKNINEGTDKQVITYSVDGEIRGLTPGGLVKQSSKLLFQQQNELVQETDPQTDRYANAKATFLQIGTDTGLNSDFIKNNLNISFPRLCEGDTPIASSFTATHDYDSGIIKYTASFDNEKICDKITTSASLTIEDSVPMIAEFIIPGRQNGPIIQLLNTKTPKIYNLSIQGVPPSGFCPTDESLNDLITTYCAESFDNSIAQSLNFDNMILMDEKYSKASDGSYTLNRKYIEIGT